MKLSRRRWENDNEEAIRACCLGVSFISNGLDQTFDLVNGGLPTVLVSILSDAFQSWHKFYLRVADERAADDSLLVCNNNGSELLSVTKSTQQAFYKSDEVKALQRVLNLLVKVSQVDTTLGEEIGRAGSQIILSRLMEQIKICVGVVESNGSCEEDFDALMDLQDTACEIYFPGIRGAMAFTDEELINRLPLVYNLRPASATNTQVGESRTILIHQVTKRQTAQVDVGYLMWPSAIVLARWLLTNEQILEGKTILEIGAGCGLVGIAAATLVEDCQKPNQVIISDFNNTVLDNISRNINLNDVGCVSTVAKLDFYQQTGCNHTGKWFAGEFNGISERYCNPVDIILAADIICQPEDAVAAAKTIYDALTPGGHAYVVCANEKHRFGVGKFAGECERLDLGVTVTNVKDMYDGCLLSECMDTATGWDLSMNLTFFEVKKDDK